MSFSEEFFKSKKLIGIIGGMSSQATLNYYKKINQHVNQELGGHEIAEQMIYSVNFGNIERFVEASDWDAGYRYLKDKATRLKAAGCEFYLMVSNTMHVVADRLKEDVDLPLLHIADVVSDRLEDDFIKNVGILGTLPVMRDEYYCDFYRSRGFNVAVPDNRNQEIVNRIIFEELCHGVVSEPSKDELRGVIKKFVQEGCQAVLLACTELGMLIQQEDFGEITVIDTLDIHAKKAAQLSLA